MVSVLTLALILSISATAAERGEDTLVVGLNAAPTSTEYSTKHDHDTSMVLQHVYEGLVGYRSDLTIGPVLAERFEVSDDFKLYRFTLRDGVQFHNGAPLTSADVKWSFERHRDPSRNWGSHCREWLDGSAEEYHRPVTITEILTPDDRTVEFRLQGKSSLFLHLLASEHCMFPIIHRDSVNEDGSWRAPVATGPYRLKDWEAGQYVELEQFRDYRAAAGAADGYTGGKTAAFDVIRFEAVDSRAAGREALLDGDIDSWFEAPVSVARELEENRNVRVASEVTPAWHLLMIQTRTDPLLRDVRIRRAIAHAIDIEAVTAEALGRYGVANPSAVATTSPFRTEAHGQRLEHDPAKARALLEEAGYANEPLAIMAAREPYPPFYTSAVAMAEMLKAAGINAHVQEASWEDVLTSYEDNSYQMISMTYSQRLHPTLMYSALIGRRADHGWYVWEDGESAALTAYSAIVDEAAQQAIFDHLHEKMLTIVPVVGIYDSPVITLLRSDLRGFEAWPVGLARYWGVRRQ